MNNQERTTSKNFREENFKPNLGGKTFFRAGQIFSVIYHLSLLVLLYILIEKGQTDSALKIFLINAVIVISATIISTIERIFFGKNRGQRGNFRRNKKRRN